jgi:pimeloyl-ACP methyl ester carboxylesterase
MGTAAGNHGNAQVSVRSGQYARLPGGITLHYASAGDPGRPLLLFLHGFPEFWYAWHAQLRHFGGDWFTVAPDLRGYNLSDQPHDVDAYKARYLLQDIAELIGALGHRDCVLVGHDWGGALAWQFAIRHPEMVRKLLIINATHPVPFAEGLAHDHAQQEASRYMNWLRAEGSELALARDDFRGMEQLMLGMGASPAWFDAATRTAYHACWRRGLRGGVNYYRASSLHPPTATEAGAAGITLDPAKFQVTVPVRVLWGEQDKAMLPSLVDRLDRFVADLTVTRVPDASHWLVHEQPGRVNAWLAQHLAG